MTKQLTFITLSFLLLLTSVTVSVGQSTSNKFFVKAATTEVDGEQITEAELEEAVRDIKKNIKKEFLAEKESEATYLIVVNERISTPQSGNPAAKSIIATLYIRKNGDWKPATKLKSGSNDIFWSLAANNLVKKAVKWINENAAAGAIPDKPSIDLTPFVGRYDSQDRKSDYIELKSDGTLFLRQKGKDYNGKYDIKDSVLTVVIGGAIGKNEILGDTITEPQGTKWIKQKP